MYLPVQTLLKGKVVLGCGSAFSLKEAEAVLPMLLACRMNLQEKKKKKSCLCYQKVQLDILC